MCGFGVFKVWGRRSRCRHIFSGSRAGAYFRVCAPRAEYAHARRHTPHACAPHAHNLHTHHAHAARVRVCPCARISHCGTPPTRPHASSLRVPPMRSRMRTTATHLRAITQGQRYGVKTLQEHLHLARAASGRSECAGVGLGTCAILACINKKKNSCKKVRCRMNIAHYCAYLTDILFNGPPTAILSAGWACGVIVGTMSSCPSHSYG